MGLEMCSFVFGEERILNLLFWFLMFLFEQENELLSISFSYGNTYSWEKQNYNSSGELRTQKSKRMKKNFKK